MIKAWKITKNTGRFDRHELGDASGGQPVGAELGYFVTEEKLRECFQLGEHILKDQGYIGVKDFKGWLKKQLGEEK